MNNPILAAVRLLCGAVLLAALAPLVTGCGVSEPPPLAGAKIGGPFTLTDQDGRRVSDTAFAGKYRLIYFGYTFCPDVCPTDVQTLMQGYRNLEKSDADLAAKIVPIFITVDPARDTPEVLKAYMGNFDPSFLALIPGSDDALAQVAKEYKIIYKKVEGKTPGSYTMDHSAGSYLYDPQGRLRLYSRYGNRMEGLVSDIRQLLK